MKSRRDSERVCPVIAAGFSVAATLVVALRFRLSPEEHDITPSMHWPEPAVVTPLEPSDGPVMVQAGNTRSCRNTNANSLAAMLGIGQDERSTVSGRELEARAAAYHTGETAPVITHWIASKDGE